MVLYVHISDTGEVCNMFKHEEDIPNAFIWAPSYTKVYSAKSSFKWLAMKHGHPSLSPLSCSVSDSTPTPTRHRRLCLGWVWCVWQISTCLCPCHVRCPYQCRCFIVSVFHRWLDCDIPTRRKAGLGFGSCHYYKISNTSFGSLIEDVYTPTFSL